MLTSAEMKTPAEISDNYSLNLQSDIDFRNEKEKLKAELERIPVMRSAQ